MKKIVLSNKLTANEYSRILSCLPKDTKLSNIKYLSTNPQELFSVELESNEFLNDNEVQYGSIKKDNDQWIVQIGEQIFPET